MKKKQPIPEQLREAIDKTILDAMQHGIPIISNGEPQLDDDGNVARMPPTASYTSAAIKWYQERRNTAEVQDDETDRILERIHKAQSKGNGIPPLDEDEPDLATGY